MAYQDELRSYFNELVGVFKGPLSVPDQQKIFSPLDIINASFIITRKYNDSVEIRRNYYMLYYRGTSYLITYTDPTSYAFCSGTGDKYRFLSLPFDPYGQSYLPDRDDYGGTEIGVDQIVSGDSTKLLCLDEKFNIVKDDNDNDCVVSITNWDAELHRGEYLIPGEYQFTYLIFVQVRDKLQEVTNNG